MHNKNTKLFGATPEAYSTAPIDPKLIFNMLFAWGRGFDLCFINAGQMLFAALFQ